MIEEFIKQVNSIEYAKYNGLKLDALESYGIHKAVAVFSFKDKLIGSLEIMENGTLDILVVGVKTEDILFFETKSIKYISIKSAVNEFLNKIVFDY